MVENNLCNFEKHLNNRLSESEIRESEMGESEIDESGIGENEMDESGNIIVPRSRPKLVTVHCSDGKYRKQIVKGCDALRQDAIMQQAFRLINEVLAPTRHSTSPAHPSAQSIHIRTYQVDFFLAIPTINLLTMLRIFWLR